MSSTGQVVGGIVGAVIGYYVGGPTGAVYGAQVGMGVGGAIDPPKGPTIRGPRLNDLNVQTATYGANIPRIYETVAITGNVMWLEGDKLKEVEVEGETGGKGGGPVSETETYAYYATFAVGLCKGPIACIRRVWVGPKLIYDVGSTDIAEVLISNQTAAKGLRFYLGTEDQEPDPRMQADRGIDSTPAYRGMAYIVFYDFALADYGNSLMGAQVRVELMRDATQDNWGRQVTNDTLGVQFNVSGGADGQVGIPYITKVKKGVIEVATVGSYDRYKFDYRGKYLGKRTADKLAIHGSLGGTYCVGQVEDVWMWVTPGATPTATSGCVFKGDLSFTNRIDEVLPIDRPLIGFGLANDGKSYIAIQGDVSGNPTLSSNNAVWTHVDYKGRLLGSGTVVGGVDQYTIGFGRLKTIHFAACSFDSVSMTIATAYGAGQGLVTLRRVENGVLSIVHQGYLSSHMFTYPSVWVDGSIAFTFSSNSYNVFSFPAIADSTIPLGEIVRQECLLSGVLTDSDIDTSALMQPVRGYRVTSTGAIRGALTPLQSAWPFDVVPRGYKIEFVPRGQDVVATVDVSELDARGSGDSSQPALVVSREMDTQLPYKVTVSYLDVNRDFEVSQQPAIRTGTTSINVSEIELPIVLDKDEGAQVADKLLRLYWLERTEIGLFRLPPSFLGLEPSDVVTINGLDATYQIRLISVTYLADGRLECSGRLDSATVYSSVAVGGDGRGTFPKLDIFGDTQSALMDVPLLRDDGDTPGFVFGATGVLDRWPGCGFFRSKDNGQTYERLSMMLPPSSIIGYAVSSLGVGRTDIVDASSALVGMFNSADISSVTQEQMFAGNNWFAYGNHGRWEIVGVQTCTMQDETTYRMTNLLRGLCGTEWVMNTHVTGDVIVKLDGALLRFVKVESGEIDQERLFKVVTFGSHVQEEDAINWTYSGVNLKPLSPIYLNGNRHPTTRDWSLSWIRRARKDATWRNGVDVPLDETTEAYEVEIYAESAMTTLKRTISGLNSASATYSSANQVADFGSNQSTLYVKVYQMSSRVGRGYPLIATISR